MKLRNWVFYPVCPKRNGKCVIFFEIWQVVKKVLEQYLNIMLCYNVVKIHNDWTSITVYFMSLKLSNVCPKRYWLLKCRVISFLETGYGLCTKVRRAGQTGLLKIKLCKKARACRSKTVETTGIFVTLFMYCLFYWCI